MPPPRIRPLRARLPPVVKPSSQPVSQPSSPRRRFPISMLLGTLLKPLRLPFAFLSFLTPLSVRTAGLAVTQSLVGRRSRWNFLQLLIVTSATGFPFLPFLKPLVLPLTCTWLYGISCKLLFPAHARSLKFWKKVIPIYIAYKQTQLVLNVSKALPHIRAKKWNKRHEWGATKVYNLCVELRGFYLKDGQFLGARTDLVPPQWSDSLRRLQDRVPPVAFYQIEKTIRESYRINRISQIFRFIDPIPLASATIAQVHRGELYDGTSIVLKAQYEDQERLCELDLLNLKRLANFLQNHDMSFFDMQSIVKEFESQLPTEFDFLREAEMMTTIRLNLKQAGLNDIIVPTVLPGLVSRKALTMTYVDGCRPDNTVFMNLWGIKPHDVIKTVGRAYGQMLLCDGVAHCDPHFGNLIILRDRRVALIDFGQSKEISDDLRKKLCYFYLSLCSKNSLHILKTFLDLGIELDIQPNQQDDKLLELVPLYASGMLDTAPLPADIEYNPFSSNCPINQAPIKKFNPDMFMILRTMGLLRSLSESLNVEQEDYWMSSLFKPFALKGLKLNPQSRTEKRKRSQRIRRFLTTGVSSPFSNLEEEKETTCNIT